MIKNIEKLTRGMAVVFCEYGSTLSIGVVTKTGARDGLANIRVQTGYGVRDRKDIPVGDILGLAVKSKPVRTPKEFFASIETPEGFSRTVREDVWREGSEWEQRTPILELSHEDGRRIEFHWYLSKQKSGRTGRRLADKIQISGHVYFKREDGREVSFDRHGVEDSFYIDESPQYAHVTDQANFIVKHTLEKRIPEALARSANMIQVPGIPFRINKDKKDAIRKQIQTGGHSFTPSGFGTGYRVSARQTRWSKRAARATETFFSLSPLYIETFDCD
jgi:hypothetical protein